MAFAEAGPARRRKTAAERRSQYQRSEARTVGKLLRAFDAVSSHRGCRPTRLIAALQVVLQRGGAHDPDDGALDPADDAADGAHDPADGAHDPADGAHDRSASEFRPTAKTRLCSHFMRGYCERAGECCFAHGVDDLGKVLSHPLSSLVDSRKNDRDAVATRSALSQSFNADAPPFVPLGPPGPAAVHTSSGSVSSKSPGTIPASGLASTSSMTVDASLEYLLSLAAMVEYPLQNHWSGIAESGHSAPTTPRPPPSPKPLKQRPTRRPTPPPSVTCHIDDYSDDGQESSRSRLQVDGCLTVSVICGIDAPYGRVGEQDFEIEAGDALAELLARSTRHFSVDWASLQAAGSVPSLVMPSTGRSLAKDDTAFGVDLCHGGVLSLQLRPLRGDWTDDEPTTPAGETVTSKGMSVPISARAVMDRLQHTKAEWSKYTTSLEQHHSLMVQKYNATMEEMQTSNMLDRLQHTKAEWSKYTTSLEQHHSLMVQKYNATMEEMQTSIKAAIGKTAAGETVTSKAARGKETAEDEVLEDTSDLQKQFHQALGALDSLAYSKPSRASSSSGW